MKTIEQVKKLASVHGAICSSQEVREAGIRPRDFYALVRDGQVTKIARGLYAVPCAEAPGYPDLIVAARLFPRGVVCLLSALYHHGLTTQIPHAVDMAIKQHDQPPRPLPAHPPIQVYWFSEPAYAAGIETIMLDGLPVRIYNREKTLIDIFKYRNKLGLDTALEALRLYKQQVSHPSISKILEFARACRVEKAMRPYLEAIQ
jgi:predicted transcriptional regulator of viral defense system